MAIKKTPIPLQAIIDYRDTLRDGDILSYETRIEEWRSSEKVEVVYEIEHCYPYFIFTTDRKSILYIDLMRDTGWWERFKGAYWGNDN